MCVCVCTCTQLSSQKPHFPVHCHLKIFGRQPEPRPSCPLLSPEPHSCFSRGFSLMFCQDRRLITPKAILSNLLSFLFPHFRTVAPSATQAQRLQTPDLSPSSTIRQPHTNSKIPQLPESCLLVNSHSATSHEIPTKSGGTVSHARIKSEHPEGDFPGGPVVENPSSNAGDAARSLVREVRYHI